MCVLNAALVASVVVVDVVGTLLLFLPLTLLTHAAVSPLQIRTCLRAVP